MVRLPIEGCSHNLFSVSVESLAMNFCSPGQGGGFALFLPTRQRAKCGVTGVAEGGQEGEREAGVLPPHPERQWSEHLVVSWRRRQGWIWRAQLLLRLDQKEGAQQHPWSSLGPVTPERNNQQSEETLLS